MEEPFGVLVQLMPALVEPVERSKKGAGVAGMDLDRPFESGTYFPDRVELGVVDRHEPAILVADAEAERLVKLQSLGSCLKTGTQPRRFSI